MRATEHDETPHVKDLHEVDRTDVALAGGKGANLGELGRMGGVLVPRGFCVTTVAFARVVSESPEVQALLEFLANSRSHDTRRTALHAELRTAVESLVLPTSLVADVRAALVRLGTRACAVRSSATAEDLAHASFAGLHDSYLGVEGEGEVLRHVVRCWASLFTDRAVAYRQQHGIDHRAVRMAVIVQELVPARAAGVLFTADPVSGHRRISTVDAVAGLGDALVAGQVTPDSYTIRDGKILRRTAAARAEQRTRGEGHTGASGAPLPNDDERTLLDDTALVRLERLGRTIEAHFGAPQDIEWCLVGNDFHVVQSRPITTLFPVPPSAEPGPRVYLSVGHQQMMTDAMRPLGLSFWQMTTPRPMAEAGGRLFVDVTAMLASPSGRANLLEMIGRSDQLMRDALGTVLARPDFIAPAAEDAPPAPLAVPPTEPLDADPTIVAALIADNQASVARLRDAIRGLTGAALLDFIRDDLQELRRHLFGALSHRAVMAGIEATWWINDRLQEWLGETNAADALAQSAPHNVTSEMGLALLDVADVMRRSPHVVELVERASDDDFLHQLQAVVGGAPPYEALLAWLERYGARGTGEIDITRPRWREHPSALLPLLRSNIRNFAEGEGARRFADGLQEAQRAEASVLERVRALPGGDAKANELKQMIDRLRTFIGYREYPKYGMVSRYALYKAALVREADRLVDQRVLDHHDDIFFLRFDELQEVVASRAADRALVRERREEFALYRTLRAPRVLTSEGEALEGSYHRHDLPQGALAGLAVSAGIAEGRARVVRAPGEAELAPGDILVTPYTDPSWTPAFVSIGGLVTEVGGAMTHGAVIAREYGIPAVVAVERATERIRDGDRIRVDGSAGYVELLASGDAVPR